MNKKKEYLLLIEEIKRCNTCRNIKAPTYHKDGEWLKNDNHGCDENKRVDLEEAYVNRWNLWHGNLDAEIMVIGQDYGCVRDYVAFDYWRVTKPE